MANKQLFQTTPGKALPKTDSRNEAGGKAYSFDAKHALAQYASTGCLNNTFYASAETQLDTVLNLCKKVEPEFIAKTAVYAREKGFMKDLPALLCAVLAVRSPELLNKIFNRVIDNGKMLRNFVQMIRSSVVGRKSLGSLPKRLVRNWIERRNDEQLFRDSVGNAPSLADVVKMVHPKPQTPEREALFAYLIGKNHDVEKLPFIVQEYEDFKRTAAEGGFSETIPDVPFQMLTSTNLSTAQWSRVAEKASWQTTRMNLNTFARHGVFDGGARLIGLKRLIGWIDKATQLVADRLRDEKEIARSKVFPYQLLAAYLNTSETDGVPRMVRNALQDAMEIATQNVPKIDGKVYVFVDVSGSMHSAITGVRKGSTSKVRCIDVAALVAATLLRKNPETVIVPFESKAFRYDLNARDSIMTNAEKLMNLPCGGTNCSAPLALLNRENATGDLVVYVSDNESWIDTPRYGYFGGSATETMKQWNAFKTRSPHAKMICIDIQPYGTTQARERPDITNVGGFSDQVFSLIADVASGASSEGHWVKVIEKIVL
jgi:60 kDa SS-A/Ro ribonucleoprotein